MVTTPKLRFAQRKRQRGIGYLLMLVAIFLMSLGLGKVLDVYSISLQREKEAELLYVGNLYRAAIKNYYLSAPDGLYKYPKNLEDLTKDPRHMVTRRYLRQLYLDPMTSQAFRALVAPEGGIWGVASASTKPSIRTVTQFDEAPPRPKTYEHWQFVYAGGTR